MWAVVDFQEWNVTAVRVQRVVDSLACVHATRDLFVIVGLFLVFF